MIQYMPKHEIAWYSASTRRLYQEWRRLKGVVTYQTASELRHVEGRMQAEMEYEDLFGKRI